MNAKELKRLLAAKGCTFETHKGGSGHLTVRRGHRKSQLPMHGAHKELGTRLGQSHSQGFGIEIMLRYRIKLEPDDNGTLLVTSPDLPGLVTFGEDRADAERRASDAIEEWIAVTISDGADVPRPRRRHDRSEILIMVPATTALKVELYWALREAGITRAELARRLHWNRESVDRLFRIDHASKLSQIEQAAQALQKSIDVHLI